MNTRLLVLVIALLCTQSIYSQAEKTDAIKPLLLDKSVLSGVGLKKVDIKDEPEKDFFQKQLFRGQDISVYVVSTETWNNKMENFPFDEFVYILHGEAIVKPAHGPSQIFYSRDYFFAPKGYTGEWEIKAGEQLHYELSVISTKRADSTSIIENDQHQLFTRSTLSGAHIKLDSSGKYVETLKEGAELTFKLLAETPTEREIEMPSNDILINVLSGQITITDSDNIEQTFYTDDFFILPNGFTGKWKSNGHGLVKFLTIEKTIN